MSWVPGLWWIAPGVDLAYFSIEPLVQAGVCSFSYLLFGQFDQIPAAINNGFEEAAQNFIDYGLAWIGSLIPLPPLPPFPPTPGCRGGRQHGGAADRRRSAHGCGRRRYRHHDRWHGGRRRDGRPRFRSGRRGRPAGAEAPSKGLRRRNRRSGRGRGCAPGRPAGRAARGANTASGRPAAATPSSTAERHQQAPGRPAHPRGPQGRRAGPAKSPSGIRRSTAAAGSAPSSRKIRTE